VPDGLFLQIKYKLIIGKRLRLNAPETFNEKIQWLKINDHDDRHTKMADKIECRKYIGEKIGKKYLVPLIDTYDTVDDIDFSVLPSKFVLKTNHDSGGVVLCNDLSILDIEAAKKKLSKSLKVNYYYSSREYPYKNITPKILCEKYLADEIVDYKMMCFNGKVKCSFTCSERQSKLGLAVDFFDMNWQRMPFTRHYRNTASPLPRPKHYSKMLKIAEKLASGITFLRVDFYEINGNLYIGELTFYPGSGFEEFTPEEYDYLLGSWLDIGQVAKVGPGR